MAKIKFNGEYEINASTRMLFPYLSTPNGLQEWFADKVTLDPDKHYIFLWDGVVHKARKVVTKPNQYVKYEFSESGDSSRDLSYVEFQLDENDMTQTSFLRITDYSDNKDQDDAKEMWANLVDALKDKVGA